jgi:predicted dehydrogenase
MKISIGMVGLGAFGPGFIKLFMDHPQVSRVALCDLDSVKLSRWSEHFQISETYGSLDEILKTDIDALVIITQHWMHAPQAIKAMKAGKHVYTAVPAAYSLEECHQLVDTVKQTGQIYMNGETSFFYPSVAFCRKKAAEGAFGKFVYCEGEYFHDLSHGLVQVYQNRYGKNWRDHTGEPPFWYITHSTSGIISVTGQHMTEVSAKGYLDTDDDKWWRSDTATGNMFSNEVGLFRLSDGGIARISEFRRIGHPGTVRFRFFGTEGSFEADVSGARWCHKNGWDAVEPTLHHEPLPEPLASNLGGHQGSHAYLVHEFVDSIVNERLPRINVWEAVRYCAPGLVAHESALRDGETLKIPDWGDAPSGFTGD